VTETSPRHGIQFVARHLPADFSYTASGELTDMMARFYCDLAFDDAGYVMVGTSRWLVVTVSVMSAVKPGLMIALFLALSAAMLPGVSHAHEKNKTHCSIDVLFENDDDGVATYFALRLQYKNQSRRNIEAVSVLVRDAAGKVIRNSDAVCGHGDEGIEAGDTGQCEKILQVITGRMSNRIGHDVWVRMIDDQRQQIGLADRCEILGVRYRNE